MSNWFQSLFLTLAQEETPANLLGRNLGNSMSYKDFKKVFFKETFVKTKKSENFWEINLSILKIRNGGRIFSRGD